MRTVFCEYTLYLFCAFFCDFLLFLLLLSPFLGILMPVHRSLLGGSERRSLEADCTPQKNFWLAFAAWRAIVCSLSQAAETVFECGVGECSAHVADAQPLASPRTGCRTGDPPCLDLDLRSRDAPAPAAPRWRKTHRGRCSAPLAIRDFVARGGGAELCGSGTWQWHFVQNRFSSARHCVRVALLGVLALLSVLRVRSFAGARVSLAFVTA